MKGGRALFLCTLPPTCKIASNCTKDGARHTSQPPSAEESKDAHMIGLSR